MKLILMSLIFSTVSFAQVQPATVKFWDGYGPVGSKCKGEPTSIALIFGNSSDQQRCELAIKGNRGAHYYRINGSECLKYSPDYNASYETKSISGLCKILAGIK